MRRTGDVEGSDTSGHVVGEVCTRLCGLGMRLQCYAMSPTVQDVNTRPHQSQLGDWEMWTAISWTECSQVAPSPHGR